MITPEAIFGLLAVIIMLFPRAICLLRWLYRRYFTFNDQPDSFQDSFLSQMHSSTRYGKVEDIEMQAHTQSLAYCKRVVSAIYQHLSVMIEV
jgi:dynactin complex subunit